MPDGLRRNRTRPFFSQFSPHAERYIRAEQNIRPPCHGISSQNRFKVFILSGSALTPMPGNWEVRGLFGNELAMEDAIEGLKKLQKVPEYKVLDRRNLQVVLSKTDSEGRELVKNIIK